jgi:hypothetical protein
MTRPGLGDPAVAGRLSAGPTHPRVEPEVADQLLRRAEPREVTDRGDDRQRDGRIHARDTHQPAHVVAAERYLPEVPVDQAKLIGVEVELTQQRRSRRLFIGG